MLLPMAGSGNTKRPKSNILGEIAGALFGAVGSSAVVVFEKSDADAPPVKPPDPTASKETSAGISVQSQGISDDWLIADGEYEPKSRGALDADQVLSAMSHLARLDILDKNDACPPSLLVQSPSGLLAFIGQGDSIFCPEVDQELAPGQAARLALRGMEALSSSSAPPPLALSSRTSIGDRASYEAKPVRRKLGWRGFIVLVIASIFFITGAVMVAGAFSMRARGVVSSDVLLAWTIAGATGFIGVALVILALRNS